MANLQVLSLLLLLASAAYSAPTQEKPAAAAEPKPAEPPQAKLAQPAAQPQVQPSQVPPAQPLPAQVPPAQVPLPAESQPTQPQPAQSQPAAQPQPEPQPAQPEPAKLQEPQEPEAPEKHEPEESPLEKPVLPEHILPAATEESDGVTKQFFKKLDGAKHTLEKLVKSGKEVLAKIPTAEEVKENFPKYKEQAQQIVFETLEHARSGALTLYQRVPVEIRDELSEGGKKVVNVFEKVLPSEVDKAVKLGYELYAKVPELEQAVEGKLAAAKVSAIAEAQKLSATTQEYYKQASLFSYEKATTTLEETKKLAQQLKKKAETVYVEINKENFEKLKKQGLIQANKLYTSARTGVTDGAQFLFNKIPSEQQLEKVFSQDGVVFAKMHINQAELFVRHQLQNAAPVYVRTLAAAKETLGAAKNTLGHAGAAVYEKLNLDQARPYVEYVKNSLEHVAKVARQNEKKVAQTLHPLGEKLGAGAESIKNAFVGAQHYVVDLFSKWMPKPAAEKTVPEQPAVQPAAQPAAQPPAQPATQPAVQAAAQPAASQQQPKPAAA